MVKTLFAMALVSAIAVADDFPTYACVAADVTQIGGLTYAEQSEVYEESLDKKPKYVHTTSYNNYRRTNSKKESKARVFHVASCDPEGQSDEWKPYFALTDVTLYHEPCEDDGSADCFTGAVFLWEDADSDDFHRCAAGIVKDDSNSESMTPADGETITTVNYTVDSEGQFDWFEINTATQSVEVGTAPVGIGEADPVFSTTDWSAVTVIGLYLDITTGLVTDFSGLYFDAATCDCDAETEVVESTFVEDMIVDSGDEQVQTINVLTDVGPDDIWNYCAVPVWSKTGVDDLPEWFSVENNVITITRDEEIEDAFTIAGEYDTAALTIDADVNVYMNDYSFCDNLDDGTADATAFTAYIESEEGVEYYEDLTWDDADAELLMLENYWWQEVQEYLSVPSEIRANCDAYIALFDAGIAAWKLETAPEEE